MVAWHGHGTEGYDFVVLPGGGRCISVAGVEGHFSGPGLSWPELQRLVARGTLGTAAQRLLLFLPATGDANLPPDAVTDVARALLSVGNTTCGYDIAREAAEQLLAGGPRWTTEGEARVCDGDHAVRRAGGLPEDDLLAVTRALR
ncbi:hypothetical protein [Symbioplanes lichenis]|uniref:hypothetical protein n=1 Tax=Symbioplanes lichenis TaxID=1629072 RepID=UPI002739F7C1|nr:hypothetical protein [Actinoplanes lichenis]